MDELFTLLENFVSTVQGSLHELTDEQSDQILQIIPQLIEYISASNRNIDQLQRPQAQTPETPVTDNVKLLWILAGGQPQSFVSYLREFPDPAFAAILRNPSYLNALVQRLQQQNPIDKLGQADGIPQAQLQSSNVYGFRFDPRSKKMQVRFQSGSVYEYEGVPDVIFNLFSHGNASAKTDGQNQWGKWWKGKNPSLGASLNQYIKEGGYPYKRLK